MRVFFFIVFYFTASDIFSSDVETQRISLGAYYFDGWRENSPHITNSLVQHFSERQPVWGWVTSKPKIMIEQINLAADAGLSFFNFCWFYSRLNKNPISSGNQALGYFLAAPNGKRMNFCIMVVNHEGHTIKSSDWKNVVNEWVTLFKSSQYLKVNGMPYLGIYDVNSLRNEFGSDECVRRALNYLRKQAVEAGMGGVTVAANVSPNANAITTAKNCGFDLLTGYNYPGVGLSSTETPINKLIERYSWVFEQFADSPLPYLPAVTLNWDNRPWVSKKNMASTRHFKGFSSESVFKSVSILRKWILDNPSKTTKERIGVLYAWNEYGEGAWLTPSVKYKNSLLLSVKRALNSEI